MKRENSKIKGQKNSKITISKFTIQNMQDDQDAKSSQLSQQPVEVDFSKQISDRNLNISDNEKLGITENNFMDKYDSSTSNAMIIMKQETHNTPYKSSLSRNKNGSPLIRDVVKAKTDERQSNSKDSFLKPRICQEESQKIQQDIDGEGGPWMGHVTSLQIQRELSIQKSIHSSGLSPRSRKLKHLIQQKKKGAFDFQEDQNLMDLQLDFEEGLNSEGSVDPLVDITKKKRCFIIRHNSKFRIRWDLFIILLVIYNCIQIPIDLAFENKFNSLGEEIFGYMVDLCFIADILLHFRTTYLNEKTGFEITDGKQIAFNYLREWRFWCDVLSVIPFELMYEAANVGSSSTTFKMFSLLKLIRLLRLGRIITYLKLRQDIKVGLRIVYLLAFLLLLVHWVSCLWYMMVNGSAWMPPLDANYGETEFYDYGMGQQYIVVFYYAILLLVGSEIAPIDTDQLIVASLVVIMGSIVTAFIFGNMAALMQQINMKDQQFQEEFDKISGMMRSIQLPVDIQEEVESYLIHIQQLPDMQQDMKLFLKLLSPSLRSQILFHVYKGIIRKISIFDQCSNIEIRYLVNKMKTLMFLPDDDIIRQGATGKKLYFISRGVVDVFIGPDENFEDAKGRSMASLYKSDNKILFEGGEREKTSINTNINSSLSKRRSQIAKIKHIRTLTEGEYFGEISLITKLKRTATIRSKDFTSLAFMPKKHFLESKEEFPQIYQSFKKAIQDRYNDENIQFRKRMLRNVPYFKKLSDAVIQELIYLLKPVRYDPNTLVVKRGDSTDKLYFLKAGTVNIEVPLKGDKMHFDTLNTGSCFCVFSAFHDERKQKFDFRTKTVCIIETISSQDILDLEKEQLELFDELKTLRIQIENNEKSDFDFFRYVVPNTNLDQNSANAKKAQLRQKFRAAFTKFLRRVKKSRAVFNLISINKKAANNRIKSQLYNKIIFRNDLSDSDEDNVERKQFKALYALDKLEKERMEKDQKLKFLQEKISNVSIMALQALAKKASNLLALNQTKEEKPKEEEEKQSLQEEDDDDFETSKIEEEDYATLQLDFQGDQNNQILKYNAKKYQENNLIDKGNQSENVHTQELEESGMVNTVLENKHRVNPQISQDLLNTVEDIKIQILDDINSYQYSSIRKREPIDPHQIIFIEKSPDKKGQDLSINFMKVQSENLNQQPQKTINKTKTNVRKKHKSEILKQKPTLKLTQSQKMIQEESTKSKLKEQDNKPDLFEILRTINDSIQRQSSNLDGFQTDMQKRIRHIDRKLIKAVKEIESNKQQDECSQQSKRNSKQSLNVIKNNGKSSNLSVQRNSLERISQKTSRSLSPTKEKTKNNNSNSQNRLVQRTNQIQNYITNNKYLQVLQEKLNPKTLFRKATEQKIMNDQLQPSSNRQSQRVNSNPHRQLQPEEKAMSIDIAKHLSTPNFVKEYLDSLMIQDRIMKGQEEILSENNTEYQDFLEKGPSFRGNYQRKIHSPNSQHRNLQHPQNNIQIINTIQDDDPIDESGIMMGPNGYVANTHQNQVISVDNLDNENRQVVNDNGPSQIEDLRLPIISQQTDQNVMYPEGECIEEIKEPLSRKGSNSQGQSQVNNNGQQVNINIIWIPNSIVQINKNQLMHGQKFQGTKDNADKSRKEQNSGKHKNYSGRYSPKFQQNNNNMQQDQNQ